MLLKHSAKRTLQCLTYPICYSYRMRGYILYVPFYTLHTDTDNHETMWHNCPEHQSNPASQVGFHGSQCQRLYIDQGTQEHFIHSYQFSTEFRILSRRQRSKHNLICESHIVLENTVFLKIFY